MPLSPATNHLGYRELEPPVAHHSKTSCTTSYSPGRTLIASQPATRPVRMQVEQFTFCELGFNSRHSRIWQVVLCSSRSVSDGLASVFSDPMWRPTWSAAPWSTQRFRVTFVRWLHHTNNCSFFSSLCCDSLVQDMLPGI